VNGNTLTANESNADYQWLDCNNEFNHIENETSQSFTPTQNGNYAVEIASESCSVVSDCFEVIVISVDELTGNSFSIYPNPAKDFVMLGNIPSGSVITVFDLTGKVIYSSKTNSSQTIINTSDFPNGVYQVQIENHNNFESRK